MQKQISTHCTKNVRNGAAILIPNAGMISANRIAPVDSVLQSLDVVELSDVSVVDDYTKKKYLSTHSLNEVRGCLPNFQTCFR